MSVKRREVLQWAAAAPLAGWAWSAAAAPSTRLLFVCDDERLKPLNLWISAPGSQLKLLPPDVDCVRFARECLAAAPEVIHGALRPGSFLVLTGAAEEAGFRLREEGTLNPPWLGGQPRITFSMQHRSGLRGA